MLIGITGIINSGKSYTAKLISDYLTHNNHFAEVRSLSDPIKGITGYLFPRWDYANLNGELKEIVDKEYGVSPRFVQQVIGVELMKIKPDIWSQILFDKLKIRCIDLLGFKDSIIIDDVRSVYDFKAVKDHNGIMICLEPNKESGCSDETMNHKAESQMKELFGKCDYKFINTYDEKFDEKIEEFIKGIYNGV